MHTDRYLTRTADKHAMHLRKDLESKVSDQWGYARRTLSVKSYARLQCLNVTLNIII